MTNKVPGRQEATLNEVVSRIVENIINNLREQMYRYRYEYVKDNTDYSVLVDEHRKIIQGLKDRNKKFVREIMHEHLENQIEAVRRIIVEQRKNKDQ